MKVLLALLACLWTLNAHPLALKADGMAIDLASAVEVLEDPGGALSFGRVLQPDMQARFGPPPSGGLNFGFSGSAYWLRLRLQHADDAPARWLLVIPYALIDEIGLYAPGQAVLRTGAREPLQSRPVHHRHFVLPIDLTTTPQDIHLRVRSRANLLVPLEAWTIGDFNRHLQVTLLAQGLYFGGLLALLLYNGFLLGTLGDRRFAWYLLYAASMGLAMFAGNGFGRQFLWPAQATFDTVAQFVFLDLGTLFSALFTIGFLQIDRWSHKLHRALQACGLVSGLTGFALLFGSDHPQAVAFLVPLGAPVSLLTTAIALSAGVLAWRRQLPGARTFTLAWTALCCGVIVATVHLFGWLPENVLTAYAVQIASALEMMLFAFALADIARSERDARVKAQTALIRLMQSSEERLGREVRERTQALEDTLRHTEQAESEQRHLLSLASHEFRTPAAIIKASLDSLNCLPEPLPAEVQRRLDNIRTASQRMQRLANDLIDQGRLQHTGLHPRLTPLDLSVFLIDLLRDYTNRDEPGPVFTAGTAGPVWIAADPSLFGIAVRNLIDNALRHNPPKAEPVRITLDCIGDLPAPAIRLRIIDHGPGVAPADRERIFERYVSTQTGPAHSGIGLPIVQRLIAAHRGSVRVRDGEPAGAIFEIECPMLLPDATPPANHPIAKEASQ